MSFEGNVESNETMYRLQGKVIAIPEVDETLTKKGCSADAKITGEELNKRVKKEDIVDNLDTEEEGKVLSAKAGKTIKAQLESFNLSQAGTVGYNNATSGLNAVNMQSAIDEVAEGVKNSLPKNGGGMIEGAIQVRSADNGFGTVSKNNSATADYGTQLADTNKAGKTAKVSVSAELNLLTFTDTSSQIRDIFHEGNKPFSQYVGNGSEDERVIDTAGIGRLIMVYSDTRISLVTPKGSLTINIISGTFEWIDGEKVHFLNGKLVLNTPSVAFNEPNATYYYQVI